MTVRETVRAKAGRLLLSGALRIHHVSDGKVTATIHGDTGTYRLGYHPRVPGGWYCTCPARPPRRSMTALAPAGMAAALGFPPPRAAGMCSHLLALVSVIEADPVTGVPQGAT